MWVMRKGDRLRLLGYIKELGFFFFFGVCAVHAVLCSLYSRRFGYCGCGRLDMLLICCVKGLVLLSCGIEEVAVCESVCAAG